MEGWGDCEPTENGENRMRWALENKSRLIPAFGYVKRRPAGECIKALAKLAYIQGARGGKTRWSAREKGRRLETLQREAVSQGPD